MHTSSTYIKHAYINYMHAHSTLLPICRSVVDKLGASKQRVQNASKDTLLQLATGSEYISGAFVVDLLLEKQRGGSLRRASMVQGSLELVLMICRRCGLAPETADGLDRDDVASLAKPAASHRNAKVFGGRDGIRGDTL